MLCHNNRILFIKSQGKKEKFYIGKIVQRYIWRHIVKDLIANPIKMN